MQKKKKALLREGKAARNRLIFVTWKLQAIDVI